MNGFNEETHDLADVWMGVAGAGKMGALIAACLLAAGHSVAVLAPEEGEKRTARKRIRGYLVTLEEAGALRSSSKELLKRLRVSQEYSVLRECRLVVESVIEDLQVKRDVIRNIEEQVAPDAIIGTNTSTYPVTSLQDGARDPGRLLGLHWLSSSPFGMGAEVMIGDMTRPEIVARTVAFVRGWGMRAVIAQRDVPGFIGNRIFYAMLREAFHIVEAGIATPEDVDYDLRFSIGTWLPFAGLFGYLDINGLRAYPDTMSNIFPHLSNETQVPAMLKVLTESGANGISNGRGIYRYPPQEARQREREFQDFQREAFALIQRYAPDAEKPDVPPKHRRKTR